MTRKAQAARRVLDRALDPRVVTRGDLIHDDRVRPEVRALANVLEAAGAIDVELHRYHHVANPSRWHATAGVPAGHRVAVDVSGTVEEALEALLVAASPSLPALAGLVIAQAHPGPSSAD